MGVGTGTAGFIGALVGGGFTVLGGAMQNAWEGRRASVQRDQALHAAVGEILAWASDLLALLRSAAAQGAPVDETTQQKLRDCASALRREVSVRSYRHKRARALKDALQPLIPAFEDLYTACVAAAGAVPDEALRQVAVHAVDDSLHALDRVRG